jgi:NitT/TauT family transport system ATP-binding protein
MIQLRAVSRDFVNRRGVLRALRDVDLYASEGEFVAVVGRSGCGKSTLLRLIAGLLPPTAGEVRIGGDPVIGPRRDVAILFQRPALLPWRSVLANVLLPVEIFGLQRSAYLDEAQRLLTMMGLNGFHKRLPHELSGGMQQRVALCRSLLQRPSVLLMDEPFSALDALTRAELSIELQHIHLEYRPTVILVTHSVEEAVFLADRVVVLTPRPGHVRTIFDVNIPRPRSLGHDAHRLDLARLSAQLHELLLAAVTPTPEA